MTHLQVRRTLIVLLSGGLDDTTTIGALGAVGVNPVDLVGPDGTTTRRALGRKAPPLDGSFSPGDAPFSWESTQESVHLLAQFLRLIVVAFPVKDGHHPGHQAADLAWTPGLDEELKGLQAVIISPINVIQLEIATGCFQVQISSLVQHSLSFRFLGLLLKDGRGLDRVSPFNTPAGSA